MSSGTAPVEADLPASPIADPEQLVKRQASHERMIDELKRLSERMELENPFVGQDVARQVRSVLDQLASSDRRPSVKKWQLHEQLGHAELRLGNERDAITQFQNAYSMGKLIPSSMPRGSAIETLFSLGLGYMRLGETENCCVQNVPESCLFPIRPAAYHTNPEGSRAAIRAWEQTLKLLRPTTARYKQTQWLLNIAHMTLGQYPDGVPDEYLIPPESFAPAMDVSAMTQQYLHSRLFRS